MYEYKNEHVTLDWDSALFISYSYGFMKISSLILFTKVTLKGIPYRYGDITLDRILDGFLKVGIRSVDLYACICRWAFAP